MLEVVLQKLTKEFTLPGGKLLRAVDELSFAVRAGEMMVLVGPSGCGKSTTLRLIAGLENPACGDVLVGGNSILKIPPAQRDVAMVFQNHALFPHLTAAENIEFGLRVRKLPGSEIMARVKEVVEMVGIADCLGKMPAELSGGQRQKVALARALVRRSNILLLDEPLSHLDAPTRMQMRQELKALHRRLGTTMIYVTHDQSEAMTMGERIAVMNCGRIQQAGEPLEVYRHPQNVFVAGFLGTPPMNLFRGPNADGKGDVALNMERCSESFKARLKSGALVVGARAEDFYLIQSGSAFVTGLKVSARVKYFEHTGAEIFVYAESSGDSFVVRPIGSARCEVGQIVEFGCFEENLSLFDAASGEAVEIA